MNISGLLSSKILLASAVVTSTIDSSPIPAAAIPSPLRLAVLPMMARKTASTAPAESVTEKMFVTSTDWPSWYANSIMRMLYSQR